VRRLLVVGGSEHTQKSLRELSQGRPVDLRLVSAEEDVSPARVQGRVEGCDVLVTWSAHIVPEPISGAYASVARAEGRLVVSVLGGACGVTRFSRAVCNRLARSLILAAV
jgi:UDP-N-acetylglucosamine:LPS N-acetylglucosamine transferase